MYGFEEDRKNQKRSRAKGCFFLLLKIIAGFVFLGFVGLVVLSKIGGSQDSLKVSIEDFFRKNTGYDARVGRLNNMSFYPTTDIDFENLSLYEPGKMDENPILTADKVKIDFSFWDVAGATGKVKAFDIQGIATMPGFILPKEIHVQSMQIIDGQKEAALKAEGSIGSTPFTMTMDIKREGEKGRGKYFFDQTRPFIIRLGNLKFLGNFVFINTKHIKIENFHVQGGAKQILQGNLDISFEKDVRIKGRLILSGHGTMLDPDVVWKREDHLLRGVVRSDVFHPEDLIEGSPFDALVADLSNILGYDQMLNYVDVNFEAPQYKGKLPVKNGSFNGKLIPQDRP